ncbi:hypothetical protein SAMN04487851_103146 [Prevotella sp. tc2-28]|uniref:hypothetical protein n=1 Tax=Prevotella sp. tc2-28 TaxID=1761888 RepID=UPI00089783DE|nr:hypothetical protein [Prevotella sp. tc2-28]SEA19318.1 hypothetical protein SAMN04487851_103146 [Prevotella sp. tc2-28]
MEKNIRYICLFLTILLMSACKSDFDKYWDIRSNASNATITELNTPEGFRFDMNKDEWNEALNHLNPKEYGYETYYEWKFGNNTYAGEIYKVRFNEGKLCYYEIWIKGKVYKSKLVKLTSNDIDNIRSYYKEKLKDKSDYVCSSEIHYSFNTHVWVKENLILELLCPTESSSPLMIQCMNQPVWASVEDEERETSSYSSPTTIPTAEVKNNKWNGGVKQVEDYLERTLRDPDSYESIEWSEVKRKEDGFYVRHKYKAKNGFGGNVVTNQLFHLDFSGNVIDVKDLY